MIIKMETESVQLMASSLRKTADELETRMNAVKTSLDAAPWESQAQVEFMEQFTSLKQVNDQSIQALCMMSQAVNKKVDQWEAISRVFNGPFYFIENIWDSALGLLENAWGWIKNGIGSIYNPQMPWRLIPGITIPGIIGTLPGLWPDWEFKPPGWWPFNPKGGEDAGTEAPSIPTEGGEDSSPEPAPSEGVEPQPVGTQPAEPIGLDQDDPPWGEETMGIPGHKIKDKGCLITSIAMIARQHGYDVTPSDVNKYMQQNGGYVKGTSNMYWGSAEKYLESLSGKNMTYSEVSSQNVSATLAAGDPVIIHVPGSTSDGHWVVATEVDSSGNFVVYESGTGQKSTYSPDQLLSGHKTFKLEG